MNLYSLLMKSKRVRESRSCRRTFIEQALGRGVLARGHTQSAVYDLSSFRIEDDGLVWLDSPGNVGFLSLLSRTHSPLVRTLIIFADVVIPYALGLGGLRSVLGVRLDSVLVPLVFSDVIPSLLSIINSVILGNDCISNHHMVKVNPLYCHNQPTCFLECTDSVTKCL